MKHFSLKRIREIIPKFNIEPIPEEEFWRVCKRFKIIVKELPLTVDGYHERKRERNYIILNRRLSGEKWLHTAFHELCHFLFDAPKTSENYVFFRGHGAEKDVRERFADAFALACILPLPELKRLSCEDLSDNPERLDIFRDRIVAFTDFHF